MEGTQNSTSAENKMFSIFFPAFGFFSSTKFQNVKQRFKALPIVFIVNQMNTKKAVSLISSLSVSMRLIICSFMFGL